MISPEQKTKDDIRLAYKKTYPNIIFTLTNSLIRKDEEIERLKVLALSEAKRLRVLLEGLKCSKGCEHDISDDQQDNGCSHCHCYHWDNDGFNKIIDQAIKANCEEKDEN